MCALSTSRLLGPAVALALLAPARAIAGAQQLHGAAALGYAWSSGPGGGPAAALLSLGGAYGLNDTFRLYANLEYALGIGNAPNGTPRHAGSLSIGIAYAIDVLSVVPWAGVGLQGSLVGSAAWVGFVPAVEVRGGLDILTSRYFGLQVQASYGFAFANRDQVGDLFTAIFGVRLTRDL